MDIVKAWLTEPIPRKGSGQAQILTSAFARGRAIVKTGGCHVPDPLRPCGESAQAGRPWAFGFNHLIAFCIVNGDSQKSLSRTDWVSKCNFCRIASREMRRKVRIFRRFPLDSVGTCRYLPATGPQSSWADIWGREPRVFAKRWGNAADGHGGMSHRGTSNGFAGGFGSAMRTGARFLWFAS